tara:strand:- start:2615 stop:2800 length:186 start_codon:yes stop_codon:yes gene_type:complete
LDYKRNKESYLRIKNKIKKFALSLKAIDIAKRRLEKAKRKRNDKKIRDKIGFEYKDRNKEW